MYCCNQMKEGVEKADGMEVGIVQYKSENEYGLRVLDGGSSYIIINFCPFCGKKLNNNA